MEMMMAIDWKVVDQDGADVIPADVISVRASMERTSPRLVAKREARNYVNVKAGDAPVFAVKA
jgi:hypothetical protein